MAIQVHQKKYERQLLGLNKWKTSKSLGLSSNDGWGTLHWCTGVGKTYAACLCANLMLSRNPSHTFIIVVPSDELYKQWSNEIKNFITEQKYHINFRVFTVHALMNLMNEGKKLECSLLILDEIHEYYSDDRLNLFNNSFIFTKWCLGLTATYEDIHKRHLNIQGILPIVDTIDEEEAEREGYISKSIEYNVAISLNDKESSKYEFHSKEIALNNSKFGGRGLNIANAILSEGGKEVAMKYASSMGWRQNLNPANDKDMEILALWSPNKIMGYAKNYMDAVRERKVLIYCAINKLVAAKEIAIKFDTLKTICFSQSTQFADALASSINSYYREKEEKLPCVVYHSQLSTQIVMDEITGKEKKKGKTKLKREAIEAIRSGRARIISTASSLDKGFDVKDIRMAITTSGTQNPTQYTQRKGRAVRREEEDTIVLVINLYVKNTVDEVWLRKRQSLTKNVIYWVDTVNDINYSPKQSTINIMEV